MDILPVVPRASGTASPFNGTAMVLPRLAQPGFLADDPFSAYLLSLSDPASQALAAVTRAAPATAGAAGKVGLGAVAAALLGSVTGPAAEAGLPVNPGPAAAALAAEPAQIPAQAAPAAASLPLVEDLPVAEAAAEPEAAVQDAGTLSAEARAAELADDAVTAAKAAVAAGNATLNTLLATGAAAVVSAGSAGIATDATAKFMGAGAQAQPSASAAAYQAIQNAIPAVNGVQGASAMAANTSSNPQGRASVQAGVTRPVAMVPAVNPAGASMIDFMS